MTIYSVEADKCIFLWPTNSSIVDILFANLPAKHFLSKLDCPCASAIMTRLFDWKLSGQTVLIAGKEAEPDNVVVVVKADKHIICVAHSLVCLFLCDVCVERGFWRLHLTVEHQRRGSRSAKSSVERDVGPIQWSWWSLVTSIFYLCLNIIKRNCSPA